MAVDDVLRAARTGLTATLVTARAAARHMRQQSSGVLLHLNSGSGQGGIPGMGSTCPADAATESLMRSLAAEPGPDGIRVHGIWTAGVADTLDADTLGEVGGSNAPSAEETVAAIAGRAALCRAPVSREVADVAAFRRPTGRRR